MQPYAPCWPEIHPVLSVAYSLDSLYRSVTQADFWIRWTYNVLINVNFEAPANGVADQLHVRCLAIKLVSEEQQQFERRECYSYDSL